MHCTILIPDRPGLKNLELIEKLKQYNHALSSALEKEILRSYAVWRYQCTWPGCSVVGESQVMIMMMMMKMMTWESGSRGETRQGPPRPHGQWRGGGPLLHGDRGARHGGAGAGRGRPQSSVQPATHTEVSKTLARIIKNNLNCRDLGCRQQGFVIKSERFPQLYVEIFVT